MTPDTTVPLEALKKIRLPVQLVLTAKPSLQLTQTAPLELTTVIHNQFQALPAFHVLQIIIAHSEACLMNQNCSVVMDSNALEERCLHTLVIKMEVIFALKVTSVQVYFWV